MKFVKMVASGSKMALRQGGVRVGFENEKYIKILFSRTAKLICLKFGMKHFLVVIYQE